MSEVQCRKSEKTIVIDEKTDIFNLAIDLWGEKSQVSMAIEEMAELIVELNKYFIRNNKKRREKLIEEIADVELMLDQVKKIVDADSEILEWKTFKIQRLIRRMKKYEKKKNKKEPSDRILLQEQSI